MAGMTVVDWGAELGAESLLDAAAAAPASPGAGELLALGAELAEMAAAVDPIRARQAVTDETPRGILARHPDGPVLVLRWYQPGAVSTVHHHAWTILTGVAGSGTVERWVDAPDGARLRSVSGLHPGQVACLGQREGHRQLAGADGSLELVLIADWGTATPQIDLEPDPSSETSAALIGCWVGAYQAGDAEAVGALCADAVLMDVNVPHWRFQTASRADLVAGLRMSEFVPGYRVVEHSGRPTADGAVVEIECRFSHDGDEHLSRQVHLLRGGGDGLVDEVTIFCTGVWNPETIERQRLYAPMVRR